MTTKIIYTNKMIEAATGITVREKQFTVLTATQRQESAISKINLQKKYYRNNSYYSINNIESIQTA